MLLSLLRLLVLPWCRWTRQLAKKVVLVLTSAWAKARYSGLWIKIQPLNYWTISACAFVENQQNRALPHVVYLKLVLHELVLENKISFWKVPLAYIGMWISDWIFPSSEHPAASPELRVQIFRHPFSESFFQESVSHPPPSPSVSEVWEPDV